MKKSPATLSSSRAPVHPTRSYSTRRDSVMDRPTIDPAMPKNPPSHLAVECAVSIANYCLTRFPCDAPPHPMLDVPWFAEKVQRCIDEATTIGLNLAKSLKEAELEIERLRNNSSAGAEPIRGDSEHTENRSHPLVQSGGDSAPSKAGRTGGPIPPTGAFSAQELAHLRNAAGDAKPYVLKMVRGAQYPLQIIHVASGQTVAEYYGVSRGTAVNRLNELNVKAGIEPRPNVAGR